MNGKLSKIGWVIVTCAALALSAWSLYWVARHYGLPGPLAVIVSASFDGAALVLGDLALKYARTHGDSGLAPRVGMLALAAASAFLNSQHAVLAHDPPAARILYAVPPVVALTVFEFESRWQRRAALRRAGRVAESLPVFGRWVWVLFPVRTMHTLRIVISRRLATVAARETGAIVPVGGADASPAEIRAWARAQGMRVNDRGQIPAHIREAYKSAAGFATLKAV